MVGRCFSLRFSLMTLAEPLHFPADLGTVAGVDIGGTKVALTLADASGIRGRWTEPTAKEGAPEALAQQILRMLAQHSAQIGSAVETLSAVGVVSCGPFVRQNGMVALATPNICGDLAPDTEAGRLPNNWTSVPLEAPLRARIATLYLENDGIGALQAERRWGALRGADHCAYVTWSTGIGVGVCVDGRPLRGKNGNAGHWGHSFVREDDSALCGCGNRGDVESLIGGKALARRFASQGFADAAALFGAARAGQPQALAIAEDVCSVMGRLLFNLVAGLDLERISLGGSVFQHHQDFLLPRLQAQLQAHMPAMTTGVQLCAAGLGDKVGDYAALALVL